MTQAADEPEAGELVRLQACPACDFSLAMRPPEGVCPECGRPYDQRFVVLTGKGRGPFGTLPGGDWRGLTSRAWRRPSCSGWGRVDPGRRR